MILSHIVAVSNNGVIGRDNTLIWDLPRDMKHFKSTTIGHFIITGRKNYDSIGRPLPNRTTLMVTRNKEISIDGVHVFNDILPAIKFAESKGQEECFIIGGQQIYEQTLELVDRIYLTRVHSEFEGDCFYPTPDSNWHLREREYFAADDKNFYPCSMMVYERKHRP